MFTRVKKLEFLKFAVKTHIKIHSSLNSNLNKRPFHL